MNKDNKAPLWLIIIASILCPPFGIVYLLKRSKHVRVLAIFVVFAIIVVIADRFIIHLSNKPTNNTKSEYNQSQQIPAPKPDNNSNNNATNATKDTKPNNAQNQVKNDKPTPSIDKTKYPKETANSYKDGSAERVTVEFLNAFIEKDWDKVVNFTALYHGDYDKEGEVKSLKGMIGLDSILGYKIKSVKRINDTQTNVGAILYVTSGLNVITEEVDIQMTPFENVRYPGSYAYKYKWYVSQIDNKGFRDMIDTRK